MNNQMEAPFSEVVVELGRMQILRTTEVNGDQAYYWAVVDADMLPIGPFPTLVECQASYFEVIAALKKPTHDKETTVEEAAEELLEESVVPEGSNVIYVDFASKVVFAKASNG